jgi:hypothetical protein
MLHSEKWVFNHKQSTIRTSLNSNAARPRRLFAASTASPTTHSAPSTAKEMYRPSKLWALEELCDKSVAFVVNIVGDERVWLAVTMALVVDVIIGDEIVAVDAIVWDCVVCTVCSVCIVVCDKDDVDRAVIEADADVTPLLVGATAPHKFALSIEVCRSPSHVVPTVDRQAPTNSVMHHTQPSAVVANPFTKQAVQLCAYCAHALLLLPSPHSNTVNCASKSVALQTQSHTCCAMFCAGSFKPDTCDGLPMIINCKRQIMMTCTHALPSNLIREWRYWGVVVKQS